MEVKCTTSYVLVKKLNINIFNKPWNKYVFIKFLTHIQQTFIPVSYIFNSP